MNYPFSAIIFGNEADSYEFGDGFEGKKQLGPLSKINIFVGANNCGKSRLMRLIASSDKLKVIPNAVCCPNSLGVINDETIKFREFARDAMMRCSCNSVNNIEDRIGELSDLEWLTEGEHELDSNISIISKISKETNVRNWSGGDPHRVLSIVSREASAVLERIPEAARQALRLPVTKKLYIPTLRSLRDLGVDDAFALRTRNDYFSHASHVQVFTGRTLYSDIERLVRGNLAERETLRHFEAWVGNVFFRGEPVALIPRINHTTLTIKIGEEAEQPIHNLGDGIQAILTLAFPLFMRAEEHIVALIEEPELFLHPWLQRVLMEMLSSRFPRHQYFLTTHSNHFLDLTLDVPSVSVFAFEKQLDASPGRERSARYEVSHVSGGDKKPLELLGVRNSSVLLTNCTIWVEGITDRRYLAHWIRLYQGSKLGIDDSKHFKEDLHYSFVEYSGGNITHWSFLDDEGPEVDRLCGTLFLIADNDGVSAGSSKAARHRKLAEVLKERFWLLPVREIENLLSPKTLRDVLISYGEEDVNMNEFRQESYASKKLGAYLESKVLRDVSLKKRRGGYAAESGTITDKVGFSEYAIKSMTSFDALSSQAQELTIKVYEFIVNHNS